MRVLSPHLKQGTHTTIQHGKAHHSIWSGQNQGEKHVYSSVLRSRVGKRPLRGSSNTRTGGSTQASCWAARFSLQSCRTSGYQPLTRSDAKHQKVDLPSACLPGDRGQISVLLMECQSTNMCCCSPYAQ